MISSDKTQRCTCATFDLLCVTAQMLSFSPAYSPTVSMDLFLLLSAFTKSSSHRPESCEPQELDKELDLKITC